MSSICISKKTVYRRLKIAGIKTHIKSIALINNKETGEKGWFFILTNGRRGKLILGNPELIFE